jgi:hypothetical protein
MNAGQDEDEKQQQHEQPINNLPGRTVSVHAEMAR